MSNIAGYAVGFILLIALVAVVGSQFATVTQLDQYTDTGTIDPTPYNITLTNIPVTVLNVTNGTITVPADNYTIFAAAQRLQINSNETFSNGTLSIIYTYEPENYVSGNVAVFLGIAMVIIMLGIILYAFKSGKGSR